MTDQPSYRLVAAAAILIVYFIVAGTLLYFIINVTHPDATWNQVSVIFNAIGALTTTAAGVLFGAEVQQANVRSAVHDSQAHAAETERKAQAMLQALDHLDPTTAAAGASAADGAAQARAVLRRALRPTPADAI